MGNENNIADIIRKDKLSWISFGFCLKVALVIIFQFILSFLVMQFLPGQELTLEKKGDWLVGKRSLAIPVFGATNYLRETQALAQNTLNLDSWHGFQEVLYAKYVSPRNVEFDFFVAQDSYFSFLFNYDVQGYSGLCFSAYTPVSPKYFVAEKSGVFKSHTQLPTLEFQPETWNHVSINTTEADLEVFLNANKVATLNDVFSPGMRFGFRGSGKKVAIDNVLMDMDNGEVLVERFGKPDWLLHFPYVFIIFMAVIGVFIYILQLYLRDISNMLSWLVSLQFCAIAGCMTILLFNYYVGNKLYPGLNTAMQNRENIQVKRNYENTATILKENYTLDATHNTIRILFLGTSQTAGHGASELADTIPRQIEKRMALQFADQDIECLNSAIAGADSNIVCDLYFKDTVKYKPDITVVNLCMNDWVLKDRLGHKKLLEKMGIAQHPYKENIERLVKFNRERGIKTLLVLEAVCPQLEPEKLPTHLDMLDVGLCLGAPVVDAYDFLKLNEDTGLLWWDVVHPSSAGYYLISDAMFEGLLPIMAIIAPRY